MIDALGPADLVAVMQRFRDALSAHREQINRLNVYPVPDGDTGTNMTLTIESVCAELEPVDASDLAAVAKAIGHGSLMGARGNSGVILSQILRGLATEIAESPTIDAAVLATALATASEKAYGAVMKPVEGTILTVVRCSAEAAGTAAAAGSDLAGLLEVTRAAGHEALAATPDLLPVLAEAGVVDAGGSGFLLLLDALLSVVDGRPLPEPDVAALAVPVGEVTGADDDGLADLRYEVMFFLDAPDERIEAFKEAWAAVGDSIVVVGGDGVWNCHIHTDDIGAAIEAGIEVGRPHRIRVTDLLEEVEERSWVADALDGSELEPVDCSAVAVAVGDGVAEIFRSLGVQWVIEGGQTMNPSTAQLLDAVEKVPAPEVVLLPNNKNIIPVAEQVDAETAKTVRVVPTTSVAEGFAALVVYDPGDSAEHNVAAMSEAAAEVVTGEVTRAVRDSTWTGGDIGEGDWIGMGPGGIRAVGPDVVGVACDLLGALVTDEHEIVTIIVGADAEEPHVGLITEWLAEHRSEVEVEVHAGGQPLYPFAFGIE